MSFKFFIIPAAVLSILYGFAMASIAQADHATITVQLWDAECALVDGMVECDIHSDYGISNVHVAMNSGIGDITVFDQNYRGCPTDVHVSLDPIVIDEDSEMTVTTCPIIVDCEGCVVCIAGSCPGEKPDNGIGRPEPLPLKNASEPADEPFVPIVLSDTDISPR